MAGGYITALLTNVSTPQEFMYGLQYGFYPHYFTYAIKKMVVFAFLITTVSAYHGYYAQGSSLEVGKIIHPGSGPKLYIHIDVQPYPDLN